MAVLRVVLDAVDILIAFLAARHRTSERLVVLVVALAQDTLACVPGKGGREFSGLIEFLVLRGDHRRAAMSL